MYIDVLRANFLFCILYILAQKKTLGLLVPALVGQIALSLGIRNLEVGTMEMIIFLLLESVPTIVFAPIPQC
jgi:hypothetical protein